MLFSTDPMLTRRPGGTAVMVLFISLLFRTIFGQFGRHGGAQRAWLAGAGEQLIESGGYLADTFDGIEFGVAIGQSLRTVRLRYRLGSERPFWITVTPCSHQVERIRFSSIAMAAETTDVGKMRNTWQALRGRRSYRSHVGRRTVGLQRLRVTPLALGSSTSAKESAGRVRVRGSGCRRLHLFSRGCPNDTLLVDIKGPPGATFKVRLSTRTSPLHRISGYPQVPPDHKVHICRVDEEKVGREGRTVPQMELSWPPTEHSEEQQIVYCVAINDRESLLHQCSAATRLHFPSGRMHPQARYDQSYLLQPSVFGKTAALRSAPIRNYIYSCTNATELRVTLPDPLARRLSSLDTEGKLFVNVYAVNQDSQLSTSYPAVVLGPRSPLDYCNAPARARKAHMPMEDRLSTQLTVHNLRWRTDLDFDLPVENLQLLFQPCLLGDRPYLVQVYRQAPIHKERNNIGVPACQLVVDRGHSVQLCASISPGSYRIHISETRSPNTSYSSPAYSAGSFVLSQRIGRVFFVPPDLSPLPQRPRHAIVQPLVSNIIEAVPKKITIIEKNCPNETAGRNTESEPCRAYRSLAEVKQNSVRTSSSQLPEGFFFNVSCQTQRLSLTLALHPEEQRLWIYTLPVPRNMSPTQRNFIFRELRKKTDYCHFAAHSVVELIGHPVHTQHICTSSEDRWIEVDLPFTYTAHGPMLVLISVYSARLSDLVGEHRQLVGQRLVNACSVVYDRCSNHARRNRCF